jgi:hypothetical protein
MRINKSSAMLALIMVAAISFSSCKKDKNIKDTDADYGGEQARLEQTFDESQDIADEGATTGSLSNFRVAPGILSGCATVTRDTTAMPHVVTIDFGPVNCMCNDGRNRRGQIIVTYSGHYRDSGSAHTISFSNYFVNDNGVTGTRTVTNMGRNANGDLYYEISVNGAITLANGNGTLSWTGNRTRTWIAGESTGPRFDDVYEITGSGNVTRPNGASFSMSILSPLVKALDCNWIKQGTVQITPSNHPVRTLDFGSGSCDDQATVTVNGNMHNITLP